MTKNLKKLIAIVLTVALCMGLGAPALAGGEPLASGPSFFVDELYYPLDLDDKGEGWYYTAATRTLTIENFSCEFFGLYSDYENENLYVEMVGDNNYCETHVRSVCYPTSADMEGGDIIFIGDGSLTVNYTLLGRDFEFHSGTVNVDGITVNAHHTIATLYDGATLNFSTAGNQSLFRSAGIVMNGGTINVEGAYNQDMAETNTFTINAGEINVVSLEGGDALKVAPTVYDALLAQGVSITSGDGAETMLNTEGQINYIRLASDTESKLTSVRLTGSGTPVAAPARPTAGETTEPTTEPTLEPTTEPTDETTADIGSGDITELVAMATEMGIDISTVSPEMARMYAEELGYDLSAYSDEQLTAILAEAAALQNAGSGETETPEPTVEPLPETVDALYADMNFVVNGETVSLEVYEINGNNYFKLRDLAQLVSGTEKQFNVVWDDAIRNIDLVSNEAYAPVGGELAEGDGTNKTGKLNASPIFKDGESVTLAAYTINGNNYFKLRDLCRAFDIGVTWDEATWTVGIDTSVGYTD